VSPDHFTEARAAHHNAILEALVEIPTVDALWKEVSGRGCGGLLEVRGDPGSKIGILTLGSVLGTLEDAMEAHPELPQARLIKLRAFRPFPAEALRQACKGLTHLIVFERAFSPGQGGIVGAEVKAALFGHDLGGPLPTILNFAAGLGGRDIGMDVYPKLMQAIETGNIGFQFFDLKPEIMPEGGF
jgi:pyruvate ferredoxin oxidoreductase alpha subunit